MAAITNHCGLRRTPSASPQEPQTAFFGPAARYSNHAAFQRGNGDQLDARLIPLSPLGERCETCPGLVLGLSRSGEGLDDKDRARAPSQLRLAAFAAKLPISPLNERDLIGQ